MNDKARLIESAGMPYTSYYELDGYINYFYGCLTPSTGSSRFFDLVSLFRRRVVACASKDESDGIGTGHPPR